MAGAGAIRSATHDDAEGIARVHVASWREVYAALLPAAVMEGNTVQRRRTLWGAHRRRWGAAHFRRGRRRCDRRVRLRRPDAGIDPRTRTNRGSRRVRRRALRARGADKHGCGIGRALLGTLANALAQDGFRSLALHVVGQNPARGFYAHLGARFLHEEPLLPGVDEGRQCAYGWSDLRGVPTGTPQ